MKTVIIAGPPRSGTTLLRDILANHPSVGATKELRFFDGMLARRNKFKSRKDIIKRIISRSEKRVRDLGGEERFEQFVSELENAKTYRTLFYTMAHFTSTKDAPDVLVEKTPTNALFMKQIRKLLPEAIIIHTMRDGRDVAASAAKKWAERKANPLKIAALWRLFVRAYQEDSKNSHFFVKYEDLVSDTEKVLSPIFEKLGLSFDPAFVESVGTNSSFSGREVRGIQKSSHYKDFLSKKEQMEIEYFIQKELLYFKYPLEFDVYTVPLRTKLRFYLATYKYQFSFTLARWGIKWLPLGI